MGEPVTWGDASGPLAPGSPAIHLSPPSGWMGDPNGLIHLGDLYQVCYQHNPRDDVWGPMHWRRAVSTDLVDWTDTGVILEPDELGTIFSGCVVLDRHNTSGLGSDQTEPLVAVFTHHGPTGQQQSIAYSVDQGSSWTKYEGNPVIASNAEHFRDPKVFWYGTQADGWWVMSVAAGDRITFYRSSDLRSWDKVGEYRTELPDSHGVWECPDLIRFDDTPDGWALIVSIMDIGPYGHSGIVAIPGRFDGATFRGTAEPYQVDQGPDFYAAQSFSNLPTGVLWMGWMSSWRYANTHPSQGRRGMQSIPRIVQRGASGRLVQLPAIVGQAATHVTGHRASAVPMGAFDVTIPAEASLAIVGTSGTVAMLEVSANLVRLERTTPIQDEPPESFSMLRVTNDDVRALIDHGSIEIFADGGASVMSALTMPGNSWDLIIEGLARVRLIQPQISSRHSKP